jgi:hypothetical protein
MFTRCQNTRKHTINSNLNEIRWSKTLRKGFRTAVRLRLKCDDTQAETRFRLSAKRTSPFKSARASVQSTTRSRGFRISGSNAGYTMFRGSVKSTGYPLHSSFSLSLPLPCVTVCHHISTGLYLQLHGRLLPPIGSERLRKRNETFSQVAGYLAEIYTICR